jgi:PAS domain-containing protein
MTWPPEQKKAGLIQKSMRVNRKAKEKIRNDELRAVNQRLTSVLASIDDLVFVLDSENRVVFI